MKIIIQEPQQKCLNKNDLLLLTCTLNSKVISNWQNCSILKNNRNIVSSLESSEFENKIFSIDDWAQNFICPEFFMIQSVKNIYVIALLK